MSLLSEITELFILIKVHYVICCCELLYFSCQRDCFVTVGTAIIPLHVLFMLHTCGMVCE
jgi:hypothetical protein